MSQKHNIKVERTKWDRYAEASLITFDQVPIQTPCFVAHTKNALEFSIYRDERTNNPTLKQCNVCFMPYYLGSKTVSLLYDAIDQKSLTGEYAYRPFIENTVFGYDPLCESTVLTGFQKDILSSKDTPGIIREYFNEIERRRKTGTIQNMSQFMRDQNERFWRQLDNNSKARSNLILTDFENSRKNGANFHLIRGPFVESVDSFELWQRIDAAGKGLGYDGIIATYFACNSSVLYNNKLMQQIINYITEDPTALTVFKFKNLNLTDLNRHTEFENYKLLLEQINAIKRANTKKSFMFLENYYQSYPTALAGADFVSTSLRGNDSDFVRGGNPVEQFSGWWLHPKKLINYRRSEVEEMSKDNGIPCDCVHCKDFKDFNGITRDFWNAHRRKHALCIWDKLMQDLRSMIYESEIENATEIVLERSRLKLFKELIPS